VNVSEVVLLCQIADRQYPPGAFDQRWRGGKRDDGAADVFRGLREVGIFLIACGLESHCDSFGAHKTWRQGDDRDALWTKISRHAESHSIDRILGEIIKDVSHELVAVPCGDIDDQSVLLR